MVSQTLYVTGLFCSCQLALTEKYHTNKLVVKSHAKYTYISLGTEAHAFVGNCYVVMCYVMEVQNMFGAEGGFFWDNAVVCTVNRLLMYS